MRTCICICAVSSLKWTTKWRLNTKKLVLTTKQVLQNQIHAACITRLTTGKIIKLQPGADPEGENGAISPPKTYERNFIHHNLVQY